MSAAPNAPLPATIEQGPENIADHVKGCRLKFEIRALKNILCNIWQGLTLGDGHPQLRFTSSYPYGATMAAARASTSGLLPQSTGPVS
jgi:hypothetical protein